jgi:hypothetical protein
MTRNKGLRFRRANTLLLPKKPFYQKKKKKKKKIVKKCFLRKRLNFNFYKNVLQIQNVGHNLCLMKIAHRQKYPYKFKIIITIALYIYIFSHALLLLLYEFWSCRASCRLFLLVANLKIGATVTAVSQISLSPMFFFLSFRWVLGFKER